MPYTHLFFDLDNTLWDFNANSRVALYDALKELQLLEKIGDYDRYFSIYHEVNERLWALYRENKINKITLRGLRFEESLELNQTPLPGIGEQLNDAYLAEMPRQLKLVDGAREVLEYLHQKYKLAIITNGFREVQFDKLTQSGLEKYFDKVIISEEVGAQKPNRKIFEHALKCMNAPKRKSLMIGDSWEADIVGARDFGIDQVFFCPDPDHCIIEPASLFPENTGTSTVVIERLEELLNQL